MKTYYPVIGLEIHAELKTQSKMFCSCKNNPDETQPNANICPICMAHPGTLPVANKEAVQHVIRVGLALGSDIADFTEFDRKNYFYPDIPKGYQISQYKYPIVSGGTLNGFGITRVHLEEDTGLSKHDRGNFTLVDYNRAGVPLMELVTEPVIHSAKDAADFARELQLLLRTLGVSEANLEKGEMRVEPNISVSDVEGKFGTKVEVKNLNSFRSVERAIEHELSRMIALYEAGRQDEIVQETRGWDENKQTTFSQRSKENAHDYRYFPDPDLPKMKLHSAFDIERMKKELPELPRAKRERYAKEYNLNEEDAELFVANKMIADFFEKVVNIVGKENAKVAANYLANDLRNTFELTNISLVSEVVNMVKDGEITSRTAKDIFTEVAAGKNIESARTYAKENNLLQQNNEDDLKPIVAQVITDNGAMVEQYKSGKEAVLQALVGMVMKATKGSANPAIAAKLLKEMM
jgi:aspartyl-tRNA(Asn)/glutamyl-tRNA(Gln) amidotransferase subunit B